MFQFAAGYGETSSMRFRTELHRLLWPAAFRLRVACCGQRTRPSRSACIGSFSVHLTIFLIVPLFSGPRCCYCCSCGTSLPDEISMIAMVSVNTSARSCLLDRKKKSQQAKSTLTLELQMARLNRSHTSPHSTSACYSYYSQNCLCTLIGTSTV